MDLGIKGKSALVAGSSQGIGLAVAEGLAAEGVNLALAARSDDRLNAVARGLCERYNVRAVAFPCDLSRRDAISPLVSVATSAFGGIDILVTNAGGPPSGSFDAIQEEDWFRTFDLTLMSVVRLCREVIPGMKARRWGRIVHLTSVSLKQPLTRLVLSNAMRAAVGGLSKTLSEECAPFGITVNCVAPGFTATDRLADLAAELSSARGVSPDEVRAGWTAAIPVGRLAAPSEIADLVAFLASERAAYITGSVIAVDGGLVKGLH